MCTEGHCKESDEFGLLQVKVETNQQWNKEDKENEEKADENEASGDSSQEKVKKKGAAQLLLDNIQKMDEDIKSGEVPAEFRQQVVDFQTMVTEASTGLEAQVRAQKTDADATLATLLGHITSRNSATQTLLSSALMTGEAASAATARSNKESCHASIPTEQNTACPILHALKVEIDNFMGDHPRPTGHDDAEWNTYIGDMSTFWHGKLQEWTTKKNACDAETTHNNAIPNHCDDQDAAFVLHFCQYRTSLLQVCATHTTEYNTERSVYETERTRLLGLVDGWRAELFAVEKIKCYLNVWLSNTAATDTSTCVNAQYDTTSMILNPPAVPDMLACDTTPVSTPADIAVCPSR
eukprot:gnl/TRDRNA2_/TRDRNA2_174510_c0_seq2.p1 gnl/TRDRNA2_/TRDRNA2_174510_c0~~gnl/TRDRNA2_/TRDRNA2_174510_c0_seq2.p1  ORF type:complete len:403 (+),score=56.48 gnl/TRDRNA2_/TRDRNA2_174510_c0_seq2:155-1210(+)